MRSVRQYIAGAVLGLAAFCALPSTAPAQDQMMAPTYARTRMGANDWQARGGHHWRGGGGGFGYGYFPPYYAPLITGSWYARPYPYHFDYYKQRWGGAPNAQSVEGPVFPNPDCPCAVEQPAEAITPTL